MTNGVTSWSYSRYGDYKQCPLMFKLKHLDKIKVPTPSYMQRGSDIHEEGEKFLKDPKARKVPVSYKHFEPQMKHLKKLNLTVEKQLGFTKDWTPTSWFGKDTHLRIVCDVAWAYEDNTAEVVDFKTGRKYDANQEQMDLFSTAPFMIWPAVTEVTTRLWYLDQPTDNEVIQEFTRKDFERIKKEWSKRIQPMFNDRKFAPKANNRCGTCHFRKENGGPCKF